VRARRRARGEETVAVDVVGEELVEEFRVDAFLAFFDVVHAAEQDAAAFVVGHCGSCSSWVRSVGGSLAAFPTDCGLGVGSGVRGWRRDSQEPGVLMKHWFHYDAGAAGCVGFAAFAFDGCVGFDA
jgi:hypothetical protein